VKPPQPAGARSQSAARLDGGDHRPAGIQLEDALERTNLQRALHRVERNGGAPGIDAMTTAQLRPYLRTNWPTIARALITGSYRPSAADGWRSRNPEAACGHSASQRCWTVSFSRRYCKS
jgi:RNA-directed DNA polymerase